jgi:hypothetical protein
MIYRLLLRLFPRDMREEFGAEMEELYRHHRAHARGGAIPRLWFAACADAVRHGLGARFEQARRRPVTRHKGMLMDLLSHDVRYALRLLFKQPAATMMMLATLALGIGANTAVFSVVHAVLLRALPYPEPDALVMVYEKRPAEGVMNNSVSPADYLDWQRLNQSFSSIASYSEATVDLTGAGDPVQLSAGGVTAGFFDVLRVRPLHGHVRPRRGSARQPSCRGARPSTMVAAIWRRPIDCGPLDHPERRLARGDRCAAAGFRAAQGPCPTLVPAGSSRRIGSTATRESLSLRLCPDQARYHTRSRTKRDGRHRPSARGAISQRK